MCTYSVNQEGFVFHSLMLENKRLNANHQYALEPRSHQSFNVDDTSVIYAPIRPFNRRPAYRHVTSFANMDGDASALVTRAAFYSSTNSLIGRFFGTSIFLKKEYGHRLSGGRCIGFIAVTMDVHRVQIQSRQRLGVETIDCQFTKHCHQLQRTFPSDDTQFRRGTSHHQVPLRDKRRQGLQLAQ